MLVLLRWFFESLGHWALAIIALTILVKGALLPLTQKSFVSMQKMQQLRPKLDALKEEYGDRKEDFAKAQMALFKREGVNPLGGCLPMLLQMPIWFALYRVLWISIELLHLVFDLGVMLRLDHMPHHGSMQGSVLGQVALQHQVVMSHVGSVAVHGFLNLV